MKHIIVPIILLGCFCSREHDVSFRFKFDNHTRGCLITTPRRTGNDQPYPLLIMLHGLNESARLHKYRCAVPKTIQDKFIIAYPNGSGFLRHNWNDFDTESSFIIRLIDTLCGRYTVDAEKVYLSGFSQGGRLAYRTALRHADRITAIALVCSKICRKFISDSCSISRPVPLLAINSISDPACPYDSCTYKGEWFNSVEEGVYKWAMKTGCIDITETDLGTARTRQTRWKDHTGKTKVTLITLNDGGHAWPGGRGLFFIPHFEPSRSLDANILISEFFLAQ